MNITHKRWEIHRRVDDVHTALWLARRISRLWTGDVPWRSRTGTYARRVAHAVLPGRR
jgi:hypothetical protein